MRVYCMETQGPYNLGSLYNYYGNNRSLVVKHLFSGCGSPLPCPHLVNNAHSVTWRPHANFQADWSSDLSVKTALHTHACMHTAPVYK